MLIVDKKWFLIFVYWKDHILFSESFDSLDLLHVKN